MRKFVILGVQKHYKVLDSEDSSKVKEDNKQALQVCVQFPCIVMLGECVCVCVCLCVCVCIV